jgi:NAD(P)-dependent dehydrogenase (short-subunit alcohol dehydrogenase family)
VRSVFADAIADAGVPDLVIFNASGYARGSILELAPGQLEAAWRVGCLGGFHVGQAAAKAMVPAGAGTILFTGATASVKGFAQSSSFAMGKFALRGLAQSMARELAPKGIHVGHVVIDGGIASSYAKTEADRAGDRFLDPDAIARTYLHLHRQHRSAWSWEVEVRPWTETF